jgi:hypothetical protein
MASNGSRRGGLLTAGGILSIVVGAFEVIGGVDSIIFVIPHWLVFFGPPGVAYSWAVVPIWLIIMGWILLVLGVIAIAGGVSALRRKSFGLSLAGALCALISVPLGILGVIFTIGSLWKAGAICALLLMTLGILAVIFVALGKSEFGTKD